MNDKNMNDKFVMSGNFIHDIIEEELAPGGRCDGARIHTRFPPEPNGYLHIGHAKAIMINFATAKKYGGICNLRMDDTNPTKEDVEYVNSIIEDIKWLGYDWGDRLFYASDYFETMYNEAVLLIKKGLAYVCEQTAAEVSVNRGDLTTPAVSPYRDRPIEENLALFEKMRGDCFADGTMTLRAKIDLASGNFNMRDPVIYRIAHVDHHRHGNTWCIYPMYDFAHPLEDMIEGITHSLCSLEFEDHRPLYNWVRDNSSIAHKSRQIEFSRLNLTHTVMSKRKLRQLVEENVVGGWDDPRMPTLSGYRRRGYTPASIRDFIDRAGVAKSTTTSELALLEHCLREDLNMSATRVMAVIDPIKLTITNYQGSEMLETENNPNAPEDGTRNISFSKTLWIERDDFMEEPIKKYFRLFPGNEVRLKSAYIIKCTSFVCDSFGNVVEVLAEYDPQTRGGTTPDGRKVRGTIHWVDAKTSKDAEIRLYDTLFTEEFPEADGRDFMDCINSQSLVVMSGCKVEETLGDASPGRSFQFMRQGYFSVDSKDSSKEKLVFNRSVSLKGSFKF